MKRIERTDSDVHMDDSSSEEIKSDILKSKSMSAMSEASSHSALRMANDTVPENENVTNDYDKAIHNLLLSSLPKNLPCREQE